MPNPTKPLETPNSARPSALAEPVPGDIQQSEFDQFLSELPAPEQMASPQQSASEFDQFMNEQANAPAPVPGQDFPVQEPSSFMGINTDLKQQLDEVPMRVAAAVAGDPASVKLTLEKFVGPENVKQTKDDFYYRKPGEKGFKKLDPSTFEIVNDLYSDFYKEHLQTIGGIGGAAMGAPAGPAGAFAGATLGVAGASAALKAGEDKLGVVRPQEADQSMGGKLKRAAMQTGEMLAEGAAFAATEGIGKKLGAMWAARRARVSGMKQLAEIAPVDRLQEGVKANLETLQELKNLGITQKIPGTDIEIPANQLLPHLSSVDKVAGSLAGDPAFEQAQKIAAENFGQTALDLVETAAGTTRGKLSAVVRSGVPLEKTLKASDINGLFNQTRRAEGAVINEFRDKVRATAKKTPLPAAQSAEVLQEIFSRLGVKSGKEGLEFPDSGTLAQLLGTDSTKVLNGFKADLTKLADKLGKGGLTVDELLNFSQLIGNKNEAASNFSGNYKLAVGKLSSALRADSREAMAMVLDPEDAKTYASKMQKFHSIAKSMSQLEGYLRDDIGLNTFAKGLVNKGKEGLANLKATREFLLQENPDMYRGLVGEFMEELALKHRNSATVTGYNPQGMRKELAGLGREYLDTLFPKKGGVSADTVLRSFDLADQLQQSIVKGTDDQVRKSAQKAVSALSAYHRGVNTAYAVLNFGTKNNRLLKMLSSEGVESFLTEVPKKERGAMRETLNGILTLARRNGTLATVENPINATIGVMPNGRQQ